MAELILLAITVVLASGLLSMVEASLFSYSVSRGHVEAEKGNLRARQAIEIRKKPFRTIATFVILSSVVSVGGSIFVGSRAAGYFSSTGLGIFSAFLTLSSILCSEIIPKNIGERWNHVIFPIAAVPLRGLTLALLPLIALLEAVVRPFAYGASPFTTSEEEIALLTKLGASEGKIEPYEAEMIQKVFKLKDITAGDIMTPRPFVTTIDGARTIKDSANIIKASTHSRLPVFEGKEDNIVGVVHVRDLLKALIDGEAEQKVSAFAREIMFVPETKIADDILRDFQEKRFHLAIVVNEYGGMAGAVGLEDVLEELVGEIIDEKDVAPDLMKRVSKTEIIAHGQTRIASINHFFNTEIKSKKTLNGYLLDKFGKLPESEAKIVLGNLTFHVLEMGMNQIGRVRITKRQD
ncbi:MAG: hypothetical protein A3H69_05220 [Candidatus Sungbacteria bacterium RIFCSPLOWO2_02_FULL_47_9]|uniref:Hemolysin n=1 Tax=Candidatus Sungbacteria bacterium RIFCSPHIGHO2_01_FULL_47_32 TaxID=1802264 RepID=A0A1G2K804_9BACT|nr:MAG: hypothetical protein UX72_C0008G0033 [Parcubacteria group bacterium GW2011_GWA2_47_10]OGZ95579.1 MAG: hypothetical protein A2633_06615 [Candidatus Sungbacteria bacterium RIFCSPHIGHO2_01_FULL_47_32]OGZ98925.1 MAG: hypothetical protein A3D57_01770 [Candidatus Sungbacteria bacterium RIFCSPHIGHO2_02_FULL_46_12]OHA06324.1 MAG: hypothetical protein A3A28_04625 [Candidatus Sungbacteria bacterium RIFCSPLOWO2_01_FULL_47_32]OHA10097.1 MAG: hypothetical protein A3H69_05220 [Candidatus Sungbacteria